MIKLPGGQKGLFAMEGGCYAKLIRLDKNAEPDIYNAMKKFGSLTENVVMTRGRFNYDDASITENSRGSYPLKNLPNPSETGTAKDPKTIFFLSADATGTLPPISRLNPKQAMYHFLMGYTSKLAGTEVGDHRTGPVFLGLLRDSPLCPGTYLNMPSYWRKNWNNREPRFIW